MERQQASDQSAIRLGVRNLTKRFSGVVALNNVSFELRRGEIHALCGENGAGKSTLIKVLSGIWPHGSYEGVLELDGREANFRGIADSEREGIAVIYQELALVPGMTVAENIFLGSEITGPAGLIDWNRVYARSRELLDEYGLKIDPAAVVGTLGVGQQQLVEIAKALSKNSSILLLDEPTAALTESEVEILLSIIATLKKRNISCIYISHKLDEVFEISDRITVLRDGQSISTLETKQASRDAVIRNMVGREIKDFFPRVNSRKGTVRLEVRDLTVCDRASGRSILEKISFSVRAGEVLGIGGLMGAGRTELLMHIFAAEGDRVGGEVLLDGRPLNHRSPAEAIAAGLVLVSEDRKRYGLILEQSIGFNLSLSSLKAFTRRGLIDFNAEFKRNRFFFESMGIKAPGQEEETRNLSGGNQQKVVLGKALMTGPKVIFLDEPTRGIDVGAKVEVYELVNRLTEEGNAVVMVSSELPELMGMSDRMLILSAGKTGGTFAKAQATQEAIMAAAMAHH